MQLLPKIHCSAMQHWVFKPYHFSNTYHDLACMIIMHPAGTGKCLKLPRPPMQSCDWTYSVCEASSSVCADIHQSTPYQCTICWCLRKDCERLCCHLRGLLHSSFQQSHQRSNHASISKCLPVILFDAQVSAVGVNEGHSK